MAADMTRAGVLLAGWYYKTKVTIELKNRWTDEKTWKIYEKKEGVS